jgi:CO/xanthine dehydrogenase Mo-binding subunit
MAAAVELSVDCDSGQVHLERAVVAADAGQIVNPEGLRSQIEGAFTQSASWTLKEQVAFDQRGVSSTDWSSYPILRFREAPEIEVVLLNRPGSPFLGVGEGAMGPAPAAIANAIYDAIGVRMRLVPFTPERIVAALSIE